MSDYAKHSLAPAWKKAADNLKGLVTLGAVNCDEETNRPLCAQYEIKEFQLLSYLNRFKRNQW